MIRALTKSMALRSAGVLLVLISIATCVAWFFWLLPTTRRNDPAWIEQFTKRAYWKSMEEDIRRYGWAHDDFGPVGDYGDKSWVVWIMDEALAGREISNCGSVGHKDAALKRITGFDAAPGTNWNTELQWLSWWSTNKQKSQVEWIQAGLRHYGVEVHIPPAEADREPLLALLGKGRVNAGDKIPPFVRYNAFRWLRDSGFQGLPFAISNLTAQTPSVIREGLLEYGKLEHIWPKSDGVGLLEFTQPEPEAETTVRSSFIRTEIRVGAYSLMIIPLIGGIGLLVYSRSRTIGDARGAGETPRGVR